VARCAKWLEEEVSLLRPEIIILLGRRAVVDVFRRYAGQRVSRLRDVAGGPYGIDVADVRVQVFAVPHPSPRAAGRRRDELYAEVGDTVAALLRSEARSTDEQ
jgi:uracil-DNA glycosylase family 4